MPTNYSGNALNGGLLQVRMPSDADGAFAETVNGALKTLADRDAFQMNVASLSFAYTSVFLYDTLGGETWETVATIVASVAFGGVFQFVVGATVQFATSDPAHPAFVRIIGDGSPVGFESSLGSTTMDTSVGMTPFTPVVVSTSLTVATSITLELQARNYPDPFTTSLVELDVAHLFAMWIPR